jgi:hypothetical protein
MELYLYSLYTLSWRGEGLQDFSVWEVRHLVLLACMDAAHRYAAAVRG